MKINLLSSTAVVTLVTGLLSTTAANAALTYSAGDLFLAFRLDGSATDLVIDIGPAASFRDAVTPQTLTLTNLTSQGDSLFGTTNGAWKTNGTVTWGAIGTPGAGTVSGDGADLLYVSEGAVDGNYLHTVAPTTNSSQAGPEGQVVSMKNYYNSAPVGTITNSAKGDTSNSLSWTVEVQNTFNSSKLQDIESPTNSTYGFDLFRVPEGTASTVTNEGRFKFGTGDQIIFTPVTVPEPSTLLFGASAFIALGFKRHRRATRPVTS